MKRFSLGLSLALEIVYSDSTQPYIRFDIYKPAHLMGLYK